MKECGDDDVIKKQLHHRQLGLKLIANVTFGYTAASFSGRMPCAEVCEKKYLTFICGQINFGH